MCAETAARLAARWREPATNQEVRSSLGKPSGTDQSRYDQDQSTAIALYQPRSVPLHCKCPEVGNRGELIPAYRRGVCKSRSYFVFPGLRSENRRTGIRKFLELPSGATHVCRASVDNCICLTDILQGSGVRQVPLIGQTLDPR